MMWRSLLAVAAVVLAAASCATGDRATMDDEWPRGRDATVTGGSVRGSGG